MEGEAQLQGDIGLLLSSPVIEGVFGVGAFCQHGVKGETAITSTALKFSAHEGNSIYSGSVLQVNALQTLACIKI